MVRIPGWRIDALISSIEAGQVGTVLINPDLMRELALDLRDARTEKAALLAACQTMVDWANCGEPMDFRAMTAIESARDAIALATTQVVHV